MKLKLTRNSTQHDLSAALDSSVDAAVSLGITEFELICELAKRIRTKLRPKVLPLRAENARIKFNPEAGP